MTPPTFLILVPALLGLVAAAPTTRPAGQGVESMTIERPILIAQSEFILRIPLQPKVSRPIEWTERKGPKCLDADDIRGAILSGPGQIDFMLNDRRRIRAKIDGECPALDFYSGFYLSPQDEKICAKRDMIRSRMGGSCEIDRFYQLVPGRPVP